VIETGFVEVAAAVSLMVLAIILSRWQKVGTEKELAIGTIRSFVQLVAVGYALELVFDLENIFAILATLLVMIIIGSYTASRRAAHIPRAGMISFISILAGSVATLGLMLAVGIIRVKAQYIIPLGGMTIGNSMNCAALVMERLHSDITSNRLAVETALSLGRNWRQAVSTYFRKAVKAGMMQMLNFFKVVGIVQLPGAMTGMILAGVSPLQAVLIQVIVGYMLTAAVTITGITAAHLAVRQMFTPADQLKI
jgi:putative ABC transport system permease protein